MKAKKGMGFKKAQSQIAKKQGISLERAGAILAAGARKAYDRKTCALTQSWLRKTHT